MKHLKLLFLALIIISCNDAVTTPEHSVFQGQIEDESIEFIILRGPHITKEIEVSEDGTFSDTLNLKSSGFYDLFVGQVRSEVYLEKGKDLSMTFNPMQMENPFSYTGDLVGPNNLLESRQVWKQQNIRYQELFALEEGDFIDTVNGLQTELEDLYGSFDITSKEFKNLLADEDAFYRAYLFENYQGAHRFYTGNNDYKASNSFYDELKNFNYADTTAFGSSAMYQELVADHYNRLASAEVSMGSSEFTLNYLKLVDKDFPNGFAKDQLMHDHLSSWLKPDENMEEAYNIYKNSNPNPENLAEFTERYEKLKTLMAGNPSPGFEYENYNGGTTSLEDLAGKYVYIDVWATWCGPCLQQIPSLKEVEQDYKGKNLQIVSISIDEPQAYDKWRDMIAERELGGIQLMADNNWRSQFVQDYGIQGIPRFILLDPEGKIVSADAPRPMDPALRTLLDGLL